MDGQEKTKAEPTGVLKRNLIAMMMLYATFIFIRHVNIEREIRLQAPLVEYSNPEMQRSFISVPGLMYMLDGLEVIGLIEEHSHFDYGRCIHSIRVNPHRKIYNLSGFGGVCPSYLTLEMYWNLTTGG